MESEPICPPPPPPLPPPPRPLGVTLVAWYLMISSGLTVVAFSALRQNAEFQKLMPEITQVGTAELLQLGLGLTVQIACGFYLLQGHALARNVFLIWTGVGILLPLLMGAFSVQMLVAAALFGLQASLLLTPQARAFFRPNPKAPTP